MGPLDNFPPMRDFPRTKLNISFKRTPSIYVWERTYNIYVLSAGILRLIILNTYGDEREGLPKKRLKEITQIQKGVGTILKLCHALA